MSEEQKVWGRKGVVVDVGGLNQLDEHTRLSALILVLASVLRVCPANFIALYSFKRALEELHVCSAFMYSQVGFVDGGRVDVDVNEDATRTQRGWRCRTMGHS